MMIYINILYNGPYLCNFKNSDAVSWESRFESQISTLIYPILTLVYPILPLIYPNLTQIYPILTWLYPILTLIYLNLTPICPWFTPIWPWFTPFGPRFTLISPWFTPFDLGFAYKWNVWILFLFSKSQFSAIIVIIGSISMNNSFQLKINNLSFLESVSYLVRPHSAPRSTSSLFDYLE